MIGVLTFALMSVAAPAAGEEDWQIREMDFGCYAAKTTYEGPRPTTFGIGFHKDDGRAMLLFQNAGWSVEDGKEYEIYLVAGDDFFTATAFGGKAGALTVPITPAVISSIAKARTLAPALKIDENSEKILEVFDLAGSAAAIAKTRTCAEDAAREEARVKRRTEKIPPDPFKP